MLVVSNADTNCVDLRFDGVYAYKALGFSEKMELVVWWYLEKVMDSPLLDCFKN